MQHVTRLLFVAVLGEPARCVRDGEHADGESGAGDDGESEHPSQVVGEAFEQEVHDVGDQDAGGDGEVIERDQFAGHFRRCNFGYVERSDEGAGADGDSEQEPEPDQHGHVHGERAAEGADDVHGAGEHLRLFAADRVGEVPG